MSGKVIKMSKGHKRHNYENRVDLVGEYRWGDAGQVILFIIFVIGMVSDLFFIKVSSSWQDAIPWYLPVIIFIPLIFISAYLVKSGLKKVFKEERKELEVIKSGVFGIVRHPIYLGSILIFLSFVILSLSLVSLIIWFVIIVFYYFICRYEEKLLIRRLGKKYRDYMKEVPMLIPRIWGK
jgi:protein-S-isoprenylcysteine O-methyltransferase Ste14